MTSNLSTGVWSLSSSAKLDLGGAQVDQGSLHVGFKLNALQLQPVEVHLGDVAHLQAVAADFEHAIVVFRLSRVTTSTAFCCSTCTKAARRSKSRLRSWSASCEMAMAVPSWALCRRNSRLLPRSCR